MRGMNMSFDPAQLIAIARTHKLGVVSPLVVGATLSVMNPPGSEYKRRLRSRWGVEFVTAIEQYATVYTRAAWECMLSLMDDESRHSSDAGDPRLILSTHRALDAIGGFVNPSDIRALHVVSKTACPRRPTTSPPRSTGSCRTLRH